MNKPLLHLCKMFVCLVFFLSLFVQVSAQGFNPSVTSATCSSACSDRLVGRVSFSYCGEGEAPSRWNLSSIAYEGKATQSITLNGLNPATGNLTDNYYTIVKNPKNINGTNGVPLQNVETDGIFLFRKGQTENAFVYKISGLNNPATVGLTAQASYCIRIKMRNVGSPNSGTDCNQRLNNIQVKIGKSNGNNLSWGTDFVVGGKWITTNTLCSNPNNGSTSGNWTGKGQWENLRTYGDYTTIEGTFQIGRQNGTNDYDNGFSIIIRSENGNNSVIGIESIEVFGCMPGETYGTVTPSPLENLCQYDTQTKPTPTLSLSAKDENSITLRWNYTGTADHYELYRCSSATGSCTTRVGENISGTTYKDTGLTSGTTYYYKLVAKKAGEDDAESKIFSAATKSEFVYVPFASGTCNNVCPTQLVGYVDFSNKDGITTGRWTLNDINKHGLATQTISVNGLNSTSGNITDNYYTIVNNPSSVNGPNGLPLQNVETEGIFLFRKGQTDDAFVYTIKGLNNPADGASGNKASYCIRIKMRNVGVSGTDCGQKLNNIQARIRKTNGNNLSWGSDFIIGGKWTTTNTICSNPNNGSTTGVWAGKNQWENLRLYGDYTVLEGTFQIGRENGINDYDDGFQIAIRSENGNNSVLGIESIEVYGCMPEPQIVATAGNTTTQVSTVSAGTEVTLTAKNMCTSGTYQWRIGNENGIILASTTNTIKVTVDQTTTYWVSCGNEKVSKTITVLKNISSTEGDNFCEGTTTTLTASGIGSISNLYIWKYTDVSSGQTITLSGQGSSINIIPQVGTFTYVVENKSTGETLSKTITVKDCCGLTSGNFSISKVCSAPKIDGYDSDAVWSMAPWTDINVNHQLNDYPNDCQNGYGTPTTSGTGYPAGKWRAIYDDANLYFYVRVYDNTPENSNNSWKNDAVEIYIASGSNNGTSRQYGFTYKAGQLSASEMYSHNTQIQAEAFVVTTPSASMGYWDIEVRIPLSGNQINLNEGFLQMELGINQSQPGAGCRAAQLFTWVAENHYTITNRMTKVVLNDCTTTRASNEIICTGGTTELSTSFVTTPKATQNQYTWQQSKDGISWVTAIFTNGDTRHNYVTVAPANNPTYYRALYNGIPTCPVKITIESVNAIASSPKTTYNIGEEITITGSTTLTGNDVQWGWKKGPDSNIANAAWIPGYGLSSDALKKTIIKSSQEGDGGYYFFVVQKDCEGSSVPVEIKIATPNPLYNCLNAADFYIQKICSTPDVDGKADEIEWNTAPWISINKNHYLDGDHDCRPFQMGIPNNNPAGKWKAMYDDQNIYFYVQVYGTNPYNASTLNNVYYWQDAVEIYINDTKQYGYTYTDNVDGKPFTYGSGNDKGTARIIRDANNWYLEVRIPVENNGINLNQDNLLLEVAINQKGAGDCRAAQLFTWSEKNHYTEGGALHPVPLSDCLITKTSLISSADEVNCGETIILSAKIVTTDYNQQYRWQESTDEGKSWQSTDTFNGDSRNNHVTVIPTIDGTQYRAIIGGITTCPVTVKVNCLVDTVYTCSGNNDFNIQKICNVPAIDGKDNELEWKAATWVSIDKNHYLDGDHDCKKNAIGTPLQTPAGQWRAMYDDNNIYFYVQVFDTIPYNQSTADDIRYWQDAVEIYINNQTQYGYTYNTGGTPFTYGNGNDKGESKIITHANGWNLEIRIPLADNNINVNQGSLSMEVAINQSKGTDNCRSAQLFTWTAANHYGEGGKLHSVPLNNCFSTQASSGSNQVICGESITLSASVTSNNPNYIYSWEQSTDGGKTWQQATVIGGDTKNNHVSAKPSVATIQYRAKLDDFYTCPVSVKTTCSPSVPEDSIYICPGNNDFSIQKICSVPTIDGKDDESEWKAATWVSIDKNHYLDGDHDCKKNAVGTPLQTPAGQWRAMYDDNNVYFYVRVFDTIPHNQSITGDIRYWQDAVEIYINNQTQYGYTYNAGSTPFTYGNGNNKGEGKIITHADGWDLELRIPVTGNNINVNQGNLLLEVAINQSKGMDNCRSAQLFTWTAANHYGEGGKLHSVSLNNCFSTQASSGSNQVICGESITLSANVTSSNTAHQYNWEQSTDGGNIWQKAVVTGGDAKNNNVSTKPSADTIQYRAKLGDIYTCPVSIKTTCGNEPTDTTIYHCLNVDTNQPHIYKVCQAPVSESDWNIAGWNKIDKQWTNLDGDEDCIKRGNATCKNEALQNPAGKWKAVYDDQFLFYYVRVYDSSPKNESGNWWQDAVEIYINNATQYGYTYPNSSVGIKTYGNGLNKGDYSVESHLLEGYWDLKVQIPIQGNNINVLAGNLLMEVAINQSNNDCNCRSAQFFSWKIGNHYEGGGLTSVALFDCLSTQVSSGNNQVTCGESVTLSANITSNNPNYTYSWEQSIDGGKTWQKAIITGGSERNNNVSVKPSTPEVHYRAKLDDLYTCPVSIKTTCNPSVPEDSIYTCPGNNDFSIQKICSIPTIDGRDNESEWKVATWVSIDKNHYLDGDHDCKKNAIGTPLQNPAGQWRAMYDDNNIYFYVQVFDTIPYNQSTADDIRYWQDAVEIYINNQTQYGYTYNTGGTPFAYGNGNDKGESKIITHANGWNLEIRIPLADNNINVNQGSLSMEVAINQSKGTDNCRSAQLFTWTAANHYGEGGKLHPIYLDNCIFTQTSVKEISCENTTVLSSNITNNDPNAKYEWQESVDGGLTWQATDVFDGDAKNNNVKVIPTVNNIQYRAKLGNIFTCPVIIKFGTTASASNTSYCPETIITIIGTTTFNGTNVKWGWKKSLDSNIANALWIENYALSNDPEKKIFTKPAKIGDNGYYFFIVETEDCTTTAIPVEIKLINDDSCGSVTPFCANKGTILFKEDFGGNNPDDPAIKPTGIPQCTYQYSLDPRGPGLYSIRKQGQSHGSWWYKVSDHTYPDDITRGYMMQVDGSTSSAVFYSHQIDNLCPGSSLYFSLWGMSAIQSGSFADANLKLVIESTTSHNLLAEKDITLENLKGYWEQFGMPFDLPLNETSVIFKIVNNSVDFSGNDFLLDDIEVRLCVPPVTIQTDDTVCENKPLTITSSFVNDGTFSEPLEYRWLKSSTGNLTIQTSWLPVGTNSTTLHIPLATKSDEGYYRLSIASHGSIDQINCRAMSEPVFISVKTEEECNNIPPIPASSCTVCTKSLNGSEDYIVQSSNERICIKPGDIYSGNIISTGNGGLWICVQGIWNAPKPVIFDGSTENCIACLEKLDITGTLNTPGLKTYSTEVINHGTLHVMGDNDFIMGPGSTLNNTGTTIIDNGDLTGPTGGSCFINNTGTIQLKGSGKKFRLKDFNGSVLTNSGTIRIDNGDFELDSNGGSPRYYNYGDIVIGGTGKFHSDADLATDNKFYNYGLIDTYDFLMDGNTALHLYNYCLINTSHDFTLQALGNSNAGIYGSTSLDSIGRINVGGVSNWISGVFTMPNQHQDFCDAGMPVGGWDSRCCVYGGIVTHCNRNSRCALPSIFSVRIQSSDNGVCPGSDVTLTAKITATYPSDAYTYIWSHNPTINAPSITVNPHVATTYSVTVIDNAHGYQATNSIAITVDVDGCVPTLICDGKISININSPTCGSNGTLNLIQNVKLNESPSICSVIWKDLNDSILGSSSTLSGVVAGKYIVEIDCGNITCKEIIPVKESSSTGGLMGTYYTKGECNFSGASIVTQRTDRTINFNWAQQPDVTLGTNVTSARWTGFVLPECSGEYTFYRESNASGKLYVNNILLVDGTGNGTIHLQGGEKYPVVYEVNNYTQNTNAKLEWKTPCKASVKEVIPSCFLEPHHLKGIIPSSDDVCPPSPCETPVINLPSSYDICKEGQSVQLKANALGTFLWSPTGATTSSINISKEGTYTVTVTNWCGKSATAQTHVGIIKDSDVGIVNPYIEACAGESVPLKATGGTCKWYPSDYLNNSTIPNPIATPPISMDYNVEIKTKGGCIVTKQVSIEMKSSFDLKVNNNTVGCLGSKITLHVEGADSYTWSPTDGLLCTNSQCSDPEYIIIGDQKVFTVTGHKDGCTKQATVIVKTGLPSENIDFTVSKTSNCELVFTANNTGFSSYSWDFGDGQIGNGRTITHRYNGHQRYQVCLEVEDKACSGVSRKCKSILVTSEDCSCIPCCHPPCSVTNK